MTKETDLYDPVKRFLQSQGYTVKAEINGCDVTALRENDQPLIVELKSALSLKLILQAVDRLSISDNVYIAIPKKSSPLKKHRRQVVSLLRRLGLGLLLVDTIATQPSVKPLLVPGRYSPRISSTRKNRLIAEFEKRKGDPNTGGAASQERLTTAYRQQSVELAEFLEWHGPSRAADVANALQIPQARNILYRNVYGWFERVDRGIYALSPQGASEAPTWR